MKRFPSWLVLSSAVALAAACSDDESSTGGSGGTSGGVPTGGSGATTTSSPGGGGTGTTTMTGGAPPCTAETLADAVRVTSVTIDGASGSQAVTAEAGSASVVAWVGADGIHVTPLDVVDARVGADLVVEGMQIYGAAATAADVALLVSRQPDYMTFVRMDLSGTVLATANLVGGGDHNQQGVEWFGEFAQTGRLVGRADGTYAAYHALHRRWPDNIGHQGDTLRLLDASGAALGGGWGWGCSHSMDQRLATGPNGLVPICIADCYPGKGIYFENAVELTPDPAANCAGGYSTGLGGLVAVQDGFFLVFQDANGGSHLGHYDAAASLLADRALGVEGSSRLAWYDDGLLLGSSGGGSSLQRLDASGQDVGGPAAVAAPLPAADFESRTNGEVAWAAAAGTTLTVVRVRICE